MSIHQGDTLKILIKKSRFRQEDFAKQLGISRTYLLVILKEVVLNEKYIDRACQILHIDRSVFTNELKETNNKNHEKSNTNINVTKTNQPMTPDLKDEKIMYLQEQLNEANQTIRDLLKERKNVLGKSKTAG